MFHTSPVFPGDVIILSSYCEFNFPLHVSSLDTSKIPPPNDSHTGVFSTVLDCPFDGSSYIFGVP